jgi:glyoxylase-like metal-dependent hydrolase (beta-lactamase superfamily II)
MQRWILLLCIAIAPILAPPVGAFSQDATPSAPPEEVQDFGGGTYAFVNGGYISLFVVTDEGVIATDPGSQGGPERAEAYKAAIESITDQPVRYLVYSHSHADHASGGGVFADTATFVSHINAVDDIANLNDPNTPVPQIAFSDRMMLQLGDKTVELIYTGRNHSDSSIVMLDPEQRVLFAVDFIPINALLFQDLPDAYPEEWIQSLQWIEDNLDFDTLVPGHPPIPGTKDNVGQVRTYLVELMAAVQAAQDEGLADNSPEMVDAIRQALEPTYGTWNNFEEWLPLNIEGMIRIRAAQAMGTPAA